MISIGFPSVLPRMPGQFIDSFQFICFFVLLQGQILCPLCQDKLMARKRVKYPRISKQDQTQRRYFFGFVSLDSDIFTTTSACVHGNGSKHIVLKQLANFR